MSVLSAQGLGLSSDVMLQQLDSISLRRRETANFLDFANVADFILAEPEVFRLHSKNHHLFFFFYLEQSLRIFYRKSLLYRRNKLSSLWRCICRSYMEIQCLLRGLVCSREHYLFCLLVLLCLTCNKKKKKKLINSARSLW